MARSNSERKDIFESEIKSAREKPGPSYKHRDFIQEKKDRKFSIGNPKPVKYNNNPGPGAYDTYI